MKPMAETHVAHSAQTALPRIAAIPWPPLFPLAALCSSRSGAIFYNYFMHSGAAGAVAELSRFSFIAINAVRAALVDVAAISNNEQWLQR